MNQILNRVTDDVIAEVARRFDPSIDDANLPTFLDDFALFQAIVSWRETAWRHAELLALAQTPEARELVAQQIEGYAASQARGIRAATRYLPLSGGSSARDAYCATLGGLAQRRPSRRLAAIGSGRAAGADDEPEARARGDGGGLYCFRAALGARDPA